MKTFRLLLVATVLLAPAGAQATMRISIDLSRQRLTAMRGGETVVWKISSGRAGYETPTGRYSVMRMEPDHHSDEYDQAPMPYAIFFSPRGLAIHGSFERGLGSPRSHGCVRLSVANAQKLYEWVEEQGGASIEIVGDAGAAAAPSRATASSRAPKVERSRFEPSHAPRRSRGLDPDDPEFLLDQAYRY